MGNDYTTQLWGESGKGERGGEKGGGREGDKEVRERDGDKHTRNKHNLASFCLPFLSNLND